MSSFIRLLLASDKVIGKRSAAISIAEANRAPGQHPGLSHVTILCLWLFAMEALFGQNSPATLPDARVSSGGAVFAIAVQADGKVIIGGRFESVNGIPRTNLARINVNGSLDEAWAVGYLGLNDFVQALAVVDTKVFVAGNFRNIGGLPRNGIAKLSTEGAGELDPGWNPGLQDPVNDSTI